MSVRSHTVRLEPAQRFFITVDRRTYAASNSSRCAMLRVHSVQSWCVIIHVVRAPSCSDILLDAPNLYTACVGS